MLTALGLILLKMALNILAPRQWTIQQTLTDAYMSYERALAQRASFEDLTKADSLWPRSPSVARSTVQVGTMPGGNVVTAEVVRTRIPDANNLVEDGGTGSDATNPAGIQTWQVQSVLVYQIGSRTYTKSRTILRTQ